MKQWVREYLRYDQNIVAICMALLAAMALGFVLFTSPRPGCMDVGEYDMRLFRMGLTRTADDLEHPEERYLTKVIEKFDIVGVDSDRLSGGVPTESLVYPVAFISTICKLFEIPFSTVYLAILFTIVSVISIYIIGKSLYTFMGNKAVVVGVLISICLFNSDNIIFFNSLYNEGMILASFLFLIAMMLRALVNEGRKGLSNLLPLLLAAYLFLTSDETMPFLGLVLLPLIIYLLYRNIPAREKRIYYLLISGGSVLLLTITCIHFIDKNGQWNAKENLYAATFNGAFYEAENRENALAYFGLPKEYGEDIGKSFYLEEDAFVIVPYSEEANDLLYNKISYSKLLSYYLTHPDTFFRLLDSSLKQTESVNNQKYLYVGEKLGQGESESVERLGYYPLIRSLFMPATLFGWMMTVLIILAVLSTILVMLKKKKMDAGICYFLYGIVFIATVRLFITVFIYGNFDIASNLFDFMVMEDIILIAMISIAVSAICVLSQFLNEEPSEKKEKPYIILDGDPFHFVYIKLQRGKELFLKQVMGNPKNTVIFMGLVATLIMGCVFFLPERIGAYNNGDFGRMMDAMGLYYTQYDILHQDEQYVTKVIENYVWMDSFDWTTITPMNPTMSQVFVATLVKLSAGAMGLNFSTIYAVLIYMVLMGISFTGFVWGCYRFFGKKATVLAAMMIVVLFGSYNMGWFNSLFSEATEMCGLLMVLGSSMIILAKEKGHVKWYWWVALMISIRFFVGGKAQVTPEILLLGPWAMLLAFYHRPSSKIKYGVQILLVGIMVVMTARSALMIYQKNNEISSGDTTYASVFAGVLVIADDPAVALEELGLDASLIADAGKHQYLAKDEYYCAPRTEMAEEMVYSKIDAIGVLKWYIQHPVQLWKVLDYTAHESAEPMPDYFLYVGEKKTEEHRTVSKFNFWEPVREYITPTAFWQYIVLYGVLILYCGKKIVSKKTQGKIKMLAAFYILFILVGAMQFPLTVIGNGFVDNVKQLFVFRLVHDMIVTTLFFAAGVFIRGKLRKYM